MLSLPLRATALGSVAGIEPARSEVTDIFTTALPMRGIGNRTVRWGTGDLGVSDINSNASLAGRTRAVAHGGPCKATSTVRESQAGFEPALSRVRSIRHLHHQRRL